MLPLQTPLFQWFSTCSVIVEIVLYIQYVYSVLYNVLLLLLCVLLGSEMSVGLGRLASMHL